MDLDQLARQAKQRDHYLRILEQRLMEQQQEPQPYGEERAQRLTLPPIAEQTLEQSRFADLDQQKLLLSRLDQLMIRARGRPTLKQSLAIPKKVSAPKTGIGRQQPSPSQQNRVQLSKSNLSYQLTKVQELPKADYSRNNITLNSGKNELLVLQEDLPPRPSLAVSNKFQETKLKIKDLKAKRNELSTYEAEAVLPCPAKDKPDSAAVPELTEQSLLQYSVSHASIEHFSFQPQKDELVMSLRQEQQSILEELAKIDARLEQITSQGTKYS